MTSTPPTTVDVPRHPTKEQLAAYLRDTVPAIVDVRIESSTVVLAGRRSEAGRAMAGADTFDDLEDALAGLTWEQDGHEIHRPGLHGRSYSVPDVTTFTVIVR